MSDPLPPAAQILKITAQVQLARAIALIAETGIADSIEQQPLTAAQLAESLDINPGATYRLLRMLAAEGIFAEDDQGRFHATPLSSVLTRGAPGSIRDLVRLPWQDIVWATYLEMPHTLATGAPAFEKAHGQPFFEFLTTNPEAGDLFDAAMALISDPEDACVAEAFDFGAYRSVVDVGGGRGGLLAALLSRYPGLEAVLFDQQQVLDAQSYLGPELLPRCELVAGDFFSAVPAGADLYVLKRILHDWTDPEVVTLLGNCRDALATGGRVLVIEAIIQPGNTPDPIKAQDVGMMLLTHGRERTVAEYGALFEAAGLSLQGVHPAPPPARVAVIEAAAAT